MPEAVRTEDEVHHLAEFFDARLTDWPAVHGALQGCLALLRRTGAAPPPLSDADAAAMLGTCAGNVFVRSLAQPARQAALQLLRVAVDGHGQALLDANIDLLDWAIASVDGEKDPRCLLEAFATLQALLALYGAQPETSVHVARLEEALDELFDVVACYFPISFTPPPDSPHTISRGQLAAALEATLVACPLFAPHLLPLLLEKLSSTLRQAKLDSLSALAAAAVAFPPETLADHLSGIWAALRSKLLAPAAVLDADLPAAEEMAEAAAACLGRSVAALQQRQQEQEQQAEQDVSSAAGVLVDAVLGDASMQDLESCVRCMESGNPAAIRRSVLCASAISRVLAALAGAGGIAASRASGLLPGVLAAAADSEPAGERSAASTCLAWAVVVSFLRASASSDTALDARLVQQIAEEAAAGAVAAAAQSISAGSEEEEEEEGSSEPSLWNTALSAYTAQQAAWLQLAAIEAVLQAPQLAAAVPQGTVDAALSAALAAITPAAAASRTLHPQATAALCALAASGVGGAAAQRAVPALLAAAMQAEGGEGPLAALQALAAASPSLQTEVFVALDGAVQTGLEAAGTSAAASSLAHRLLRAAADLALAAEAEGTQQAQQQCGQLAQHLQDAVLMLDPSAEISAPRDASLAAAIAEAAFYAARAADGESQQRLAASAAEALLEGGAAARGLAAAVCSAVLAPADPAALSGVLSGSNAAELVQQLVGTAMSSDATGECGGSVVARFARLAAEALVNKAAGEAAEQLNECMASLAEQQLVPAAERGDGGAWAALAALAQGFAMRGHTQADAIVGKVLALLERLADSVANSAASGGSANTPNAKQSLQNGSAAGGPRDVALAQAAASFFHAVLAVDSAPAAVALNKQARAVARPLWQQRLYTQASSHLISLLQSSMRGGVVAATDGTPSTQDSQQQPAMTSSALLLAMGQLLRGAPPGVVAADMPRMLPWVLRCLAKLQQPPWADRELLLFLLPTVGTLLGTEQGRREAEGALPSLVPALLGLAVWRPAAAVREAALQGLLALAELPYTSLHPYGQQVTKAAAAACDDPKRMVRQQAARVRQAWAA